MTAARPLRAVALAWLACQAAVLHAQEADGPGASRYDSGAALARAIHERPDGDDAATRGAMTLTGGKRRERVRELYTYRRDAGFEGSRTLIRFTRPANIRDTGLLVHNQAGGANDQWLFLPALERVRRLSTENRGGSFVQSELSYEDLEEREPAEDRHRILRRERYGDTPVTVLESVPREASGSIYRKWIRYVHEETLIPVRVDYYRRGPEPVKRLEVQRIERRAGYWTVMTSTMRELGSGRKTVLRVEDVAYDQGLPRELFTARALSEPALEVRYRP